MKIIIIIIIVTTLYIIYTPIKNLLIKSYNSDLARISFLSNMHAKSLFKTQKNVELKQKKMSIKINKATCNKRALLLPPTFYIRITRVPKPKRRTNEKKLRGGERVKKKKKR